MLWLILGVGDRWSFRRVVAEPPCWRGEMRFTNPWFSLTLGWQRKGADVAATTIPAADASSPDEDDLTSAVRPQLEQEPQR